jgi:hypothetical protein
MRRLTTILVLVLALLFTGCISSVRTLSPEAPTAGQHARWEYVQEWNCPMSDSASHAQATNDTILKKASRDGWRLVSANVAPNDRKCWVFTFERPMLMQTVARR